MRTIFPPNLFRNIKDDPIQHHMSNVDSCRIGNIGYGIFRTERGFLLLEGTVVHKCITEYKTYVKFAEFKVLSEYTTPSCIQFDNHWYDERKKQQLGENPYSTKEYTNQDIIFISGHGKRTMAEGIFKNRITQIKEKIKEEVEKRKADHAEALIVHQECIDELDDVLNNL